jgi:dTMP kinase
MKINLPLFIVFEGIDGSGKTTLSDMVFNYLLENGLPAIKGMEPTDGRWGKEIRKFLKKGGSNADELLSLFLKDREDDVENFILPSLTSRKVIIWDRYYFSNAAYQGAMGIPPASVIQENRSRNFPEPDRIYLVDLDPESALTRITGRNKNNKKDIFEKADFLKKVREIYNSISDQRFVVLDGARKTEENLKIILDDITGNFSNL